MKIHQDIIRIRDVVMNDHFLKLLPGFHRQPFVRQAVALVWALVIVLLPLCYASAQWHVQAGYSYADEPGYHGVSASLQHKLIDIEGLALHLRLEGHHQRGIVRRGYVDSRDRIYRIDIAPILEKQISRFTLRGGVALGVERARFSWSTCPPRAYCIWASSALNHMETAFYLGGLVELSFDLPGPVYPFLTYRRAHAFHDTPVDDNVPRGALERVAHIRRTFNSFQAGVGVSF